MTDLKQEVKKLSTSKKIILGGVILTLIGCFTPIMIGAGNLLSMPYGWLFLILTLAVPVILFFVDKPWSRDAELMISEALAVCMIVATFFFMKIAVILNGIGIGYFDLIGTGGIFLLIGTIVMTIGAYLNK